MEKKRSPIGILLSLSLGVVFTLSAFMAVLFGANVYTGVLDNASANDVSRTAVLFVLNKIRQSDKTHGVVLGNVEGEKALILRNTVANETVLTYLYLYNGALCEVSALSGTEVAKSAGQPVLPLTGFAIQSINAGLLRVDIADHIGHEAGFFVATRAAEVLP